MMKLFFGVLFLTLMSQANDCVNRALASAQKAEGGAAAGATAVKPTTSASTGKVSAGMENPITGRPLSDIQATVINQRAESVKAALGRDLTPDEAMKLLSDADTRKMLGPENFQKYVSERTSPGAVAVAAAEEAKKQVLAQERAAAQKIADEKYRKEQKEAAARSEERRANEYLGGKKDTPVFENSVDNMTPTGAKLALEANAPANTIAAARAVAGLESVMSELAAKIPKLQAALKASVESDIASKTLKGAEGTRTKELKGNLEKALRECNGVATMAAKAGLNAASVREKVSDFVSSTCR